MPSVVTLREFEACEIALPAEAYRVLKTRYAGQIEAGATGRPGVYRVAARDYVGRVGLPGGLLLVIRPKVAVANLFYMLASDAGLARFYPPPTGLAPDSEIFNFVVALLLEKIEALLRGGLYSAHVPVEADLPLVRGRILLGAQVARYGEMRHRHVCAYSTLTPDTAENRVVAATLRLLPRLLRPSTEQPLVRRARALLPRFEGVRAVNRSEALALLPGILLHRLNSAYGPVLGLCGLALQGLTLDERPGPHPFASFLVEMPRLFESFVTARLKALVPARGLRVVAQRSDFLDEARRVGIRPDVLVYRAGGRSPVLVLDAKYRRAGPDEGGLNRDLYQVSAYLDRYGLRRGVLVYPRFGEADHTELKLRGTQKRLHLATVDLAAPDPSSLEESCAALAGQVARLCGE